MIDTPRPIPESYWVIPGQLLAGEHPCHYNEEHTRRRLDLLIEAGIELWIDLTHAQETVPYAEILCEEGRAYSRNVTHRRFPIADFGLPTSEQMNSILDMIDESLHSGRKIYLHCMGGIGRTGTTVGCYLVRHGRSGAEALEQLAAWWQNVPKSCHYPHSPETAQQMDFVLHWAQNDWTNPRA